MMTSLHNSALILDDTMPAIPMRITHSFPPRGIVANILTNNKNTKGNSLYLYGSLKEHSIPSATRAKIRNEDVSFSLPPTLTEKAFKTRKTPRFYTIDTSGLRQQNIYKVDQALNQLITNSDSTDLKEIYHRICKGNISTLQTLISKKKISQKFVFVQNSSPVTRYPHQTRILTAKKQEPEQITVEQQCRNRENETSQKIMNKRVLVPSPYFSRKNNEKTTSLSEASSQHILYSNSYSEHYRNNIRKTPIEPTVINLNDKLPELGKDRNLNSRFPTKNRTTKSSAFRRKNETCS